MAFGLAEGELRAGLSLVECRVMKRNQLFSMNRRRAMEYKKRESGQYRVAGV